jgi:FKBP-type peptidyl-prolyl cis-trans isomerase
MTIGARFLIGMAAALVAAGPVRAAAATTAEFLACAAEKDDARRLACFDAAVDRARAAPANPAPAVVAAPLSQEEKFGLRGELKQEKAQKVPELQELEQLQAQVTKVSTKPHGELVVTLENGQVWTEIQTSSGARVKTGDRVTIKPGALGSFLLVAPNGRSTRVTRVR